MTVILEYLTALLEYINLFKSDVLPNYLIASRDTVLISYKKIKQLFYQLLVPITTIIYIS